MEGIKEQHLRKHSRYTHYFQENCLNKLKVILQNCRKFDIISEARFVYTYEVVD